MHRSARARFAGAAMLLALSLSGCGTAEVKMEATASFADTSQKTVDNARQFYKDIVTADQSVQSFRSTVDPQCPVLAPGDDREAPGFVDPTALPMLMELESKLPGKTHALTAACRAYAAQACRADKSGGLDCHPIVGTVVANGFFCPSDAAVDCAKTLKRDDIDRVSKYLHTIVDRQIFLSRTDADFAAALQGVDILTHYLDSLAKLAKSPDNTVSADIKSYADTFNDLKGDVDAAHKTTGTTAASTPTAATRNTNSASALGGLVAPLSQLAEIIDKAVTDARSAGQIAEQLQNTGSQQAVSNAILNLAKATDSNYCSVYANEALQNAGLIDDYLRFGFGPNDLSGRQALVDRLRDYESTFKTVQHKCAALSQARNGDAAYRPVSPAGAMLMQIRKSNDELLAVVVDDKLSSAQREAATKKTFETYKSAIQALAKLIATSKAL
ncbi:MAG TPA: hypothetical protein VIM98_12585 [Dyella sp.]|uniref:hypothetical protein n=1 Tax=Dyella sp. TaxID=1869338 RepID=UPI002F9485D4